MVQPEILDFPKCGRMCIYDAIVCKLTKSLEILDGTADGALQVMSVYMLRMSEMV